MTWDRIGRCKHIHEMKLDNQRNGKTVDFAIENATRYVDNHRSFTYKEDADTSRERKIKATQYDALDSHLLVQKDNGQSCNKIRLHMGLNWEELAWLVFKYFRFHIVILVLSSMLNIDNKNYALIKIYFFHLVRPHDNLFCSAFHLYI